MPSKMIGFRVSDDAVSALEGVMEPGESLNQTAQRVLLQALGVASGNRAATVNSIANNSVNTAVNVDVSRQLADLRQEVEGKLADIKADLLAELTDQINGLVDVRVGESVA